MNNEITVEVAPDLLQVLGCSDDPFWYRGAEYRVNQLDCSQLFFDDGGPKSASRLHIIFYGSKGYFKGTLADMILERLGCSHKAVRCKRPEAKHG